MNLRTLGIKTAKHPLKPIYLQDTLAKKKEEFVPIVAGKVRIYNCGPTVYDEQHIGNFRAAVFVDILRRVFEYNNYDVKQIMNITDVGHLTGDNEGDADWGEDKVEKKAREDGKTVKQVVSRVSKRFFKDLELLNARNPKNPFPKASEHIPEQIAFIKTLEEKGFTYKTSDGIYFDTSKFKDYGKLGNINIEGLVEGARIGKNNEKINPTDFALWKFSKEEEARQQEWDSPWGTGFPGWHIECSAMAMKYLGKRVDIHTGGIEHIPIHHNNEIAQTETATGTKYVSYWLHNAHLKLEGAKLSKSAGRCVYVRQIIDRGFSPLSFRYLLLTSHYSTPMNFTWDAIEGAQTAYFKLLRFFVEKLGSRSGTVLSDYQEKFQTYINDDLDTPKAVALLHDLMKDTSVKKQDIRATFLDFDKVLALGFKEANTKLLENLSGEKKLRVGDIPTEIQDLLKEREYARNEKNFGRSDAIRDEIEAKGYEIIDSPDGVSVKKKT